MEQAVAEILRLGLPGAIIVVLLLAVIKLHSLLQESHAQLLLLQEKMFSALSTAASSMEFHTTTIQRQSDAMDTLARSSDATTHALRALEMQSKNLENSVSNLRGRS